MKELLEGIVRGDLLHGTLSHLSGVEDPSIPFKKVIRKIVIKGKPLYQVTEHYQQKVLHWNLDPLACSALVDASLPKCYLQGVFQMTSAYFHVLGGKNKQLKVIKKDLSQTTTEDHLSLSHNRKKNYSLQDGVAIPFLVELGLMEANGKVIAKKYDKFKQINKFIELVSDVLPYLPKDRPIEIVDFGCGKASLTFALYHYLHHIEKREISMTGFDLKADVIEQCQAVADRLQYSSLKFVLGDINRYIPKEKVHLVISLHACDTATDAALEKAVKWNADVILCIPCCQHELYGQIKSAELKSILRHGILKERFAAIATDAARADILETLGYDVQISEFIDLEHTPKNLMLRGIRQKSAEREQHAKKRYLSLKEALHIHPSIEKRFPLSED